MTRSLKPRKPHSFIRCTYRPVEKCGETATFDYGVPFVNRYGNLKHRHKAACDACAKLILAKYPMTQVKA